VEPGFWRTIAIVLIIGTAVMAIGGGLLFLGFRRFENAKKGDVGHVLLLVATLVFVLLCSVVLLILALR
jgi:hypothetical protein